MSFFEQVSIDSVLGEPINVTILVALLLMCLLLISLLPMLREYFKERKINKSVQGLGSQYIKQAILPDGMGGSVFLDYIILSQQSIILVILKKFRGTIFCADNIEQWTQLINNKSYKFPNTLQQLDSDISSVGSMIKGIEVSGLVVFSNECEFPKGKPEQVKTISELKKTDIDKQLHSEKLLNAWYKLKEMTVNHLSSQSFAKDYFKDKDVKNNYSIPVILAVTIIVWLVWRISFAS